MSNDINKNTFTSTTGHSNRKHNLYSEPKSEKSKVYKTEDDALKASFLELEKQKTERIILGDKLFEQMASIPDVRTSVTERLQTKLKEIANLKKSLWNSRTKQVEYRTELEEKKVSLTAMQACVRQYETKFKKVRDITMAGIERQSDILASANDFMERGEHGQFNIDSDSEDEHENNKVSYSYVDKDIFK